MKLSTDKQERKEVPIGTGVLDYFPLALAEVAHVSYVGNQQHNPGQPLHWARDKSTDHADCIIRHFMERGTLDIDGTRHSAKLAWRALALLQTEIENDVARPISDASRDSRTAVHASNGQAELGRHSEIFAGADGVVSTASTSETFTVNLPQPRPIKKGT